MKNSYFVNVADPRHREHYGKCLIDDHTSVRIESLELTDVFDFDCIDKAEIIPSGVDPGGTKRSRADYTK